MSTKQVLQFGAVVLQNLPEMSGGAMQRYIDDPKGVQNILRRAFMIFPILMTVKLGTGLKSADDFRQAMKNAGMKIDGYANYMLNNRFAFRVADQPTELNIVAPTVAELGFKNSARYADICQRGLELGYGLCPRELGPQVCLQRNQPEGEALHMTMEAIIYADDDLLGAFSVECDANGQQLKYICADPDFPLNSSDRIVFVCRK